MDHALLIACLLSSTVLAQSLTSIPSPIICLDTLDGVSRFRHADIPCLLGCGSPVTRPTGDLLPGMVNSTAIPYCQLDCVHRSASPAQSAIAPECNAGCRDTGGSFPENMGWCMFWCAQGYSDIVHSTTCIPSLVYGDPTPTVIAPDLTVTHAQFTQPPEFVKWLETQTLMGASLGIGAPLTSLKPSSDIASTSSDSTRISSTPSATTYYGPSSATVVEESSTGAFTSAVPGTPLPGANVDAEGIVDDGNGEGDEENQASGKEIMCFWGIIMTTLGVVVNTIRLL